jgi:hypothetical protein
MRRSPILDSWVRKVNGARERLLAVAGLADGFARP